MWSLCLAFLIQHNILEAHLCCRCISTSFLFVPFYIFSMSVDGLLCCFHFMAIKNNVATNICMHVFMWTYVLISFGQIPRSGIARKVIFTF